MLLGWVREAVEALQHDHENEREVVAIDGKTLRGSYEDGDPKAAIHMVSAASRRGVAWASANDMVLAGRKVEDKSNEITAIPQLLTMLDLRGCIVTIDAMGCQTDIAEQVCQAEADYVLALKGNQGNLHADVRAYFEEGKKRGLEAMPVSVAEQTNIRHGRKEIRRCVASADVKWVAGYKQWANLTSIALVEYCRDVYAEKPAWEQRFYISSASLEAEAMLNTVRRHWEIENKVHWVLDVSFQEDASRVRRRDGAENFSRLRRMALNLLRSDSTAKRQSIKGRCKQAGWDHQYLEHLIEP